MIFLIYFSHFLFYFYNIYTDLGHSISKDTKSVQSTTLNPDFFSFYEFSTTLPGPSLLKVSYFRHQKFCRLRVFPFFIFYFLFFIFYFLQNLNEIEYSFPYLFDTYTCIDFILIYFDYHLFSSTLHSSPLFSSSLLLFNLIDSSYGQESFELR